MILRANGLVSPVRPPSPSQLLPKGKEGLPAGQQPTAPVPRRAYPQPLEEEEEDIMLDLDLNPGQSSRR